MRSNTYMRCSMDLKDLVQVLNKKASKTVKRLTILSFLLLLVTFVLTILGYLNLSKDPIQPVDSLRDFSFIVLTFQVILLFIGNIAKHHFFKGIFLFIIKTAILGVIALIVFMGTPGMSYFGIQFTDVYAIVLASQLVAIAKLFIS